MVGSLSLRTPMVSLEAALRPREKKSSPSPSRKRKRDERESIDDFSIDLHLDAPLPPEWQRCLDIQSGRIHFYNTRTQRRTSKDPRRDVPVESPARINLDLDLNLFCESSPSVSNGGEMVAAVCGRCYMLVMMTRSSPSCPNCKFSHLPEDMPPLKPSVRALVL